MPTEMQIHDLTQATGVNGTDVLPIDTGSATYKVPASLLISALKNIGNLPTGVKGNAESTYRTGNVNLTPANVGALASSGGILTGSVRWQMGVDYSSPTETVSKSLIQAMDNSDTPRHQILSMITTSGEYRTVLQARQDSDHQCTLGPALDASGNAMYNVSHPAAFRSAIKAVEYTNTNAARPRIYNGVESLGLTVGSATVIAAFRALPDGGILYANANQFSSSEVPATVGIVEINRVVEASRAVVSFYGKQVGNGDYRMYEAATTYNGNNANEPSGTWVKSGMILASGVKQFGTLSAGSQTYETISLSPALGTSNYIVVTECISSNIVAGVQSKLSSSFVLYVRNVTSGNATGTVAWAIIALP